jgi:hypothetical protein
MGEIVRRWAAACGVATLLVIAACSGGGSSTASTPQQQQNQAGNNGGNTPAQQQNQAPTVKISVNKYESCHDPSQKKSTGPSDGLWDLDFTGAPDKTKVTVTFKSSIGDKQVTGSGVVGADGQVTIRIPLQSFGEVLEVVGAHLEFPDGSTDDLTGADLVGLSKETVESTSQCDLEGDATADAGATSN